ncbi:AraC family transcriptional regulator [Cystobacter fuscus]|uniref:AraC family transcriptional regulator n=1 Tax=Cystobacter fuscus TaxID=43 RepID=UPI0037BE5082
MSERYPRASGFLMLERTENMRDRSKMSDDPFSDILRLANARSVLSGGFTAGGSWAIRVPAPENIKFFAIVKGECQLRIDGEGAPVRVEKGDVVFISAQRSFVLSSNPRAIPKDGTRVFATSTTRFPKLGEGEDFFLLGGHVRIDVASGGLLEELLPSLMHVRATSPQATMLNWLIDRLVHEHETNLSGVSLASELLVQLMLVQTLRAHLATASTLPAGWLRAMGDQRIAPALRLMHREPGHPWRLEELAKASAMSRTNFAVHFKSVAGVSPLAYLTAWRMRLAQRGLRDEDASVAELARSLGYTSESAFSNAFKRVTGRAPKHYRSAAKAARPGGY